MEIFLSSFEEHNLNKEQDIKSINLKLDNHNLTSPGN